jgi:uncharacterized protein YdaU (DUF1376 family)
MAKDKLDLDWFPFYWQKFIIGTFKMKPDEIGGYVLLLIHEWDKGFLPTENEELQNISMLSGKKLEKVLQKFKNIDGRFYNDTLEIIRIEQGEKMEKSSDRGKKGAKVRWDKHKENIAQVMLKQCETNSIRGEEIRGDKNRVEESDTQPELNFNYMIAGKEILSVEETFKEKFQILFNDLNIKHGELKIKKWIADFSTLHKQKSWKDYQDFRHHISSYIKISSEKKDNGTTKQTTTTDGNVGGFGSFK